MPVSNLPIYPSSLVNAGAVINNASGTGNVTIRTAGGNGEKLECISITSTDTVARVLNVIINVGGTDYQVGTINVPIAAGTDAASTPAVSLLENSSMMPWVRRDSNGRAYVYLATGSILKLSAQVTLTSGKVINVTCQIGVY